MNSNIFTLALISKERTSNDFFSLQEYTTKYPTRLTGYPTPREAERCRISKIVLLNEVLSLASLGPNLGTVRGLVYKARSPQYVLILTWRYYSKKKKERKKRIEKKEIF